MVLLYVTQPHVTDWQHLLTLCATQHYVMYFRAMHLCVMLPHPYYATRLQTADHHPMYSLHGTRYLYARPPALRPHVMRRYAMSPYAQSLQNYYLTSMTCQPWASCRLPTFSVKAMSVLPSMVISLSS